MTSLIRQRQQIAGERNAAIGFIALGVASVVFAITGGIWSESLSALGAGGVGLVLAVSGVFRLVPARRKLAAFEAEHGVGAGKQQSIR